MSDAAFVFAGVEVVASLSGALLLPAAATLIVADLHLEKGSSFARHGMPLPPYDSRATLAALARVLDRHRPRCVVCLGDSFHDAHGPGRLDACDRAALAALMAARDWLWVTGNHDPAPPVDLGGEAVAELVFAGLTLRHAALPAAPAGEVSGHVHPKASVATAARRISARCFVGDDRRLILPAFGAFTGGLDVFDPAIAGLLGPAFTAWVLGRRRVHGMASGALLRPDQIRDERRCVGDSERQGRKR